MALVKTTKVAASSTTGMADPGPDKPRSEAKSVPVRRAVPEIGREALLERVAAATEELASGLSETAAAAQQLRGSMEQIASGADEAAGASRQQLEAVNRVFESMRAARGEAETLRRRTESAQLLLSETSGRIAASVRSIERGARRQEATAESITELERRAQNIGEITKTVRRISEQTNLLALNAAIEAARAGNHGRGFAVVADEVRALAENTDNRARDVQRLADEITRELRAVVVAIKKAKDASLADAKAAFAVVETLAGRREDMLQIARASEQMLASATVAERSVSEARKGAEQVASAAEQQSRAADQARTAAQQQAQALDQGQGAARALATAAEQLRGGKSAASRPHEIGAAAEELSATIQQLSTAASQIMAAVEQIDRGAQLQAAATQQTVAAMTQIESSANLALGASRQSSERIDRIVLAMRESRASIDKLVAGAAAAHKDSLEYMRTISRLETSGRRIERIVDGIALTSAQTSMLSVSGAVEAARAGDAGRGFALVSKDINDLAREAAENVEHATETVRGILDQIATLKRELDRSAATAELEIENNHAVFAALDEIDADLATLTAAGRVIHEGAETILASVSQAAAGARQIATAAEQGRAASRQAAAAANEQARGAEDLAAAIEEIASLAEAMKRPHGDD